MWTFTWTGTEQILYRGKVLFPFYSNLCFVHVVYTLYIVKPKCDIIAPNKTILKVDIFFNWRGGVHYWAKQQNQRKKGIVSVYITNITLTPFSKLICNVVFSLGENLILGFKKKISPISAKSLIKFKLR